MTSNSSGGMPDPPDERTGGDERAVSQSQWQRRQRPRRRPEHDLGGEPRVVFGVVAMTLEDLLLGLPARDRTERVRARGRVSDDTAGCAAARLVVEPLLADMGQQHLVETGGVTHRAARG